MNAFIVHLAQLFAGLRALSERGPLDLIARGKGYKRDDYVAVIREKGGERAEESSEKKREKLIFSFSFPVFFFFFFSSNVVTTDDRLDPCI